VNLLAECSCCGMPNSMSVRGFIGTGATALRHIDQLSDGTHRIVDLGVTPG